MPTKPMTHETVLLDAQKASDVPLRIYGRPQKRIDGSQRIHESTETQIRFYVDAQKRNKEREAAIQHGRPK
jgi:hypothetical protein